MAKRSGLGSAFYVDSHDISGDIGMLNSIALTRALQDVSGLDKYGTERLVLRSDGEMSFTGFWNAAAGASVPVLRDLPNTDVQATYASGPSIAEWAATLIGKKTAFAAQRGADGSMALTGQVMGGSGFRLEWGQLLTIGKQTFASTQAVSAWQATHDYALNDLVQPTTPNGHYYKATADTGSSDSVEPTWPTNGTSVVDDGITWHDEGLLPNGIDRGVGSASNFGLAAYLHAFSLGSGTANLKLQDSADRVAWDDVPAAAFTAVTGGTKQRVQTSTSENVRRYLRVLVSGTFTNLVAAVHAVVYRTQQ